MPFRIVRGDITKIHADAIVNTANPNPVVGGGTDTAVYEAAGREKLLAERKKIGKIERGEIFMSLLTFLRLSPLLVRAAFMACPKALKS